MTNGPTGSLMVPSHSLPTSLTKPLTSITDRPTNQPTPINESDDDNELSVPAGAAGKHVRRRSSFFHRMKRGLSGVFSAGATHDPQFDEARMQWEQLRKCVSGIMKHMADLTVHQRAVVETSAQLGADFHNFFVMPGLLQKKDKKQGTKKKSKGGGRAGPTTPPRQPKVLTNKDSSKSPPASPVAGGVLVMPDMMMAIQVSDDSEQHPFEKAVEINHQKMEAVAGAEVPKYKHMMKAKRADTAVGKVSAVVRLFDDFKKRIDLRDDIRRDMDYYLRKVEALRQKRAKALKKGKRETEDMIKRRERNEKKLSDLTRDYNIINKSLSESLQYCWDHRWEFLGPVFKEMVETQNAFFQVSGAVAKEVEEEVSSHPVNFPPWDSVMSLTAQSTIGPQINFKPHNRHRKKLKSPASQGKKGALGGKKEELEIDSSSDEEGVAGGVTAATGSPKHEALVEGNEEGDPGGISAVQLAEAAAAEDDLGDL